MKLTILSVAYPLTPVGLDAVGGSEQILTLIDAALCKKGHRSLVLACEGSQTAGTLLATPKWDGPLTDEVRAWGQQQHRIAIEQALEQYSVDLIHMHSLDFHQYLPSGDVPVLTTLHLPPDWYPAEIYQPRHSKLWFNCVSDSETRSCPPTQHLLPYIDNGVDVNRLNRTDVRKGDFVFALGRVCPEKGLHLALEAAHLADMSMLLAGEVFRYETHEQYYEQEIVPRLDERRRYIGPVGLRRKRRLLTQARCLLIPSLVAETSSLVAMEALSCGTPVIAFPSGALPEIVDDGKTGFIVQDEQEMASAIRRINLIDPAICRRTAREKFSAERMTSRYIQRYMDLTARNIPQFAFSTGADTAFSYLDGR